MLPEAAVKRALFSPAHTCCRLKTHTFWYVKLAYRPYWNAQKCWWKWQYMTFFFGTGFKTLCFHLSILETERFQRDSFQMAPLLKPSLISVLGGVHDGQREKKVRVFTRKRVSLVGASEFLGRLRQSQCCFASFNHAEHLNGFASFSFSTKT